MTLLALILFIVAAVVFGIDAWLTKSLLALGWMVFTIGFICLYLVHGAMVS
jgi:hypothetical protein